MDIISKSESGGFEGYASVFFKLDRHGHIVMPGAFSKSIGKFLKEGFIGGIGHDYGTPIGKYKSAYEDDKGLFVVGELSDVPEAKTVRTLLKDGVITKLSIGFEPLVTERATMNEVRKMWKKANYTPNSDDMIRVKQYESEGVLLIKEANLLEVSPVSIPSNDDARIMAYKALDGVPEFKRFIHTARSAAFKLATKRGRVLSAQNEMKLQAMLEVLDSVAEEMKSLLLLVQRQPEVSGEDDTEEKEGNITEPAKDRLASAEAEDAQEMDEQERDVSAGKDKSKSKGKKELAKSVQARIKIIELLQK